MRAYILNDKDFESLLAEIDRNPEYGEAGGSSQVFSEDERAAFQKAHRFYNYIIRKWTNKMKEGA